MMAAGPLARTASPRKKPRKRAEKKTDPSLASGWPFVGWWGSGGVTVEEVDGKEEAECGRRPRSGAAKTMAMVRIAAKGISVAAAWEKPIMPTVVGRSTRSQ